MSDPSVKRRQVNVLLPALIFDRLAAFAESTGLATPTAAARVLIEQGLDRAEGHADETRAVYRAALFELSQQLKEALREVFEKNGLNPGSFGPPRATPYRELTDEDLVKAAFDESNRRRDDSGKKP